jgi:hypothetical protein
LPSSSDYQLLLLPFDRRKNRPGAAAASDSCELAGRSVGRKKEDPQPNPPTPNPLKKKKEKEGGKRWVVLSDPTTTTPPSLFSSPISHSSENIR